MNKKRHDLLVKSIEREMGDKVTVMDVDAERPDGYYSALLEYVDGALQDHSASIAA